MGTDKENRKRYSSLAPAVEQAAVILKFLAIEPRIKVSLTDISRIVGINKSKTFAILGALQNAGFVSKETKSKRYSLGPEIIPIGHAALKNIDYHNHAEPFLKKLAQETMCTVMFGFIYDEKLIIISKQSSGHEVDSNLDIASTRRLFYKAHGVAILASLPEDEQKKILSRKKIFKDLELGIINKTELMKEISETKKRGYAMTTGEFSPLIKVLASAVIGFNNSPIGAIIIMGLIDESDISNRGKQLVETAKDLSISLGARNQALDSFRIVNSL